MSKKRDKALKVKAKRKGQSRADIGSKYTYAYLIENVMANEDAKLLNGGLRLVGNGVTITVYARTKFAGSWGNFVMEAETHPDCTSTKIKKALENWPIYFNKVEDAIKDAEFWMKEWGVFMGSFWSEVTSMRPTPAGPNDL